MIRARDRLGRPLPAGAVDAAPPVPVDVGATDEAAWQAALDYLADGLPFHAHEALELRWRAAPPPDRAAWRALAQWGAALTHAARGNAIGARRLAQRALETLDGAAGVPACVDLALVRESCDGLIGTSGQGAQ